jgi:hypothetical protein
MTVNISDPKLSSVEDKMAFSAAANEIGKELRKRMAPKGSLGLSPLLDARRLECGIPNGAFKQQAVFDRIYLHQLAEDNKETYGDTQIVMPETVRERKQHEAPRGVIVSAGLKALDNLKSNGIDVGHIVRFIRLSPWRMPIENICGVDKYIMILRDGDITGSEDLSEALRKGECEIKVREYKDEEGVLQRCHMYLNKDGDIWEPEMPWIPDDY